MRKQIIAMGGAALPQELDNLLLVRYFLAQTRRTKPKVAFIGAAHGDSDAGRLRFYAGFSQFQCRPTHLSLFARTPRDLESFVLEQDAIFVGGGNTKSMLAVWRDWGLDGYLRTAWERGVVLGGVSAGSICWFQGGTTDSFGPELRPVTNALGLLPYGNGVHYDTDEGRRPLIHDLVADGTLPTTHCTDDGVGLVYRGTDLVEAVTEIPGKGAYIVTRDGDAATEERVEPRRLPGV